MKLEVHPEAGAVAARAAQLVAVEARLAVGVRARFAAAVSGGRTPWAMLRALAAEQLPWGSVHLLQVDERVAPAGDPARNLTHLWEILVARGPLEAAHLHAMPVEDPELDAAAARYARELAAVAGTPPVLDLVHLGLGSDGHTASLVPGDAVLQVADADLALTAPYQGHRRMTLTYPALNRARRVLWVVTGADKADAVARLWRGDPSIPAGRVRADHAVLLVDAAAAAALPRTA